jgi:hypothetical protein
VAFAILLIRGFPVGGFEDAKEVGKKIDQHARGYENAGRDARERLISPPHHAGGPLTSYFSPLT